MKALITYDYGEENINKIKKLGYDITIIDEKEIGELENLDEFDILVCYNPFLKININDMKNLKWIQLSSMGVDQVPMDDLIGKNIILTNNRGGYSIPIGEWIVLKILEMYKNTKSIYENQENKLWYMDTSLLELYKKNIMFLGTGSLAKEAVKRLRGFDVNIIGINTDGRKLDDYDENYSMDNMDIALKKSDIVVITVPSTKKTRNIVNKDFFDKMKTDSILINVSRGNIVNEKDLIESLNNGKLKKAALDVFEKEPLEENSPLWDMKNVLISSHNSWISEMRNIRKFETIYENFKRFNNKERLKNIVNIKKEY